MTTRPPQRTTSPATESHPLALDQKSAFVHVVWSPDSDCVGKRLVLGDDVLLIGRELQVEGICADDQRLSRIHARIALDPRAGAYRIGDGQSRNGTFVNGQRITTCLLSNGDVIRAGDSLVIYGHYDAMARMREQLELVARMPATVLVRGETGTGKELIARALHDRSGRKGPFVPINCASIPPELIAAEFFGHTKSAFSGATAARKGMFAAAEGGTLFLDEIGDCPPQVQAALLRSLQEKTIRPIGAEHEIPIDVRVVAATNADLEAGMERGAFRADLFARLSQVVLQVPPLRERRVELPALIAALAAELGLSLAPSVDGLEAMLCWHWPFNVRELQSLLQSCTACASGAGLGLTQLGETCPELVRAVTGRRNHSQRPPSLVPQPVELGGNRNRLHALLTEHDGNVSAVAKTLGKPRAQVYRWMKAFGLTASRFRR